MIYIPKYKDIYSKNDTLGIGTQIQGEYRVTQRGADGRIKYETDWLPNTMLDNGLQLARYNWGGNWLLEMRLGDSDIPVDITQTGLQGTYADKSDNAAGTYAYANQVPPYEKVTIKRFTFNPGTATGTHKEFVIVMSTLDHTNACIRVVLDAPIIKGASDSLDIEHRLTLYYDLVDKIGVIDISGVDYDYVLRHGLIKHTPYGHPGSLAPASGAYWYGCKVGASGIGTIEEAIPGPETGSGNADSNTLTVGGVLGTYYANAELIWGVTKANGDIGAIGFSLAAGGSGYTGAGPTYAKCSLAKVSDGTPLTKEYTHEFRINFRTYPQRYVP